MFAVLVTYLRFSVGSKLPPMVRSRSPPIANSESRIASASSRRRFIRHSSRFSGSISTAASFQFVFCCHTAEWSIFRWIALIDQPLCTKSFASQSSNSGCVGASPSLPKLSGERTKPSPKWACQTRLTSTLAVSGWFGRVSHSASWSRPLTVSAMGCSVPQVKTRGMRRLTSSPSVV